MTGATQGGSWGAAWRFGNGNLGFSNNGTGTIVQVKIEDAGAAQPTFTVVATVPGPPASGNDGASIPGAPVDLAITKSADPVYVPGGTVTYTLTVVNNGEGESSGWTVTDSAPAELSNVTATGAANCSVSGNDVSCAGGRLAVGESAVITVTGTVGSTELGCFVNAASVLGNELDPVAENDTSSAEVCARELQIAKSSDATASSRVGDVVTYTVVAENIGSAAFTEEDPAFVLDSLTGVLDDASYNADATANRAGAVSYTEPTLSWSGALGVGESVELTYSVTLSAGGDGVVRNVAWVPNDPNDPVPPACDAPEDGSDAETGEACAEAEYLLPRLTVSKTADRTDLPAIGEVVEYEITVTNVGPGAYTADAPATFADDLTDVLDAAEYNQDAVESVGSVSYDEPELSWNGALAAGESATVTYSVTYTGEGDQNLRNTVCIPADMVAPGATACDIVQLPGSGLTQWKSVSASESPVAAGTVLTYTLFFANDGEAAATVDSVDDLTHVLDDADVVVEPSSDVLTVSREGVRISVTGSVDPGETASVSYEVVVRADGERGDDLAANFLMVNDPENPPVVPEVPTCQPADAELPDCTSTPIGRILMSKAVSASTDPVGEGTVLTYTLTFENQGEANAVVDHEDVLSDVLDDATLTDAPAASSPRSASPRSSTSASRSKVISRPEQR